MLSINIFILCVGTLFVPSGVLLIVFRRKAFLATLTGQRSAFGRAADRMSKRSNPNGNIYIVVGSGWIVLGIALIISAVSKLTA